MSDQPALFDVINPAPAPRASWPPPTAHARKSDPETSHIAAESLPPSVIQTVRARVLDLVREWGPVSDDALILHYRARYDGDQGTTSESTIRTRRNELCKAGLVGDSGKRTANNRPATLWDLTERIK